MQHLDSPTYIVALIQARMGSTRLPGKALLCLHDHPVISWVVHRTQKSRCVHKVVVATSVASNNDPLVAYLHQQNIACFRGSEHDVLARFHEAAHSYNATHVVRICADNPLIWGEEIDVLIHEYFAQQQTLSGCDYAYNHIPRNNRYPDGIGAEIVSAKLLTHLHKTARLAPHREHCLSYIWDNTSKFAIHTFDPKKTALHRPDVRLDMDTEADYHFLRSLPLHIDMPPEEILALCPDSQ